MVRQLAHKRKHDEGGFSLIELLVVVTILAILAAIAIPTFLNQKRKAWDANTTNDTHNLGVAIAADYAAASGTPTVVGGDGSPTSNSGNITINGAAEAKNGAIVYADTAGAWCVSKQSTSGKVFTIASTNRNVYESAYVCSSVTAPASGSYSGGSALISATGNLLTANQASLESGTTAGWYGHPTVGANASMSVVATSGGDGTNALQVTSIVTGDAGISSGNYSGGGAGAVPVIAGNTYTFQIDVKTMPGTTGVSTLFRLGYWNSGTWVNYSTGADLLYVTPTSSWQTAKLIVTIPAGVNQASIIENGNYPAGQGLLFDKAGIWSGSGGVWAPPGQAIYS